MQNGPIADVDDDQPIAIRRKRRGSASLNLQRDDQNNKESTTRRALGIATPPSTPHRNKKRVRFTESSPSTASGLTPLFGRNSLYSPPPSGSRRRSTPFKRWNLASDDYPTSGNVQFTPLRQILDGKVKRRLRRRRLSEENNAIETEIKIKKKSQVAEIERLQEEVREKDRKIHELRNELDLANQICGEAGIQSMNASNLEEKIRSVELEATKLRAEVQKQKHEASMHDEPDWMVEAPDLLDDDDNFIQDYDEDFNAEMTDIFHSTPSRRSFLSPPATTPNTPSKSTSISDASSQATTADERLHLESQLKTLQDELETLSKTLELTNATHDRLEAKLAPYISTSTEPEGTESLDAALDMVLTQLALSESTALDNEARFSALSNELVGFFSLESADPDLILQKLHAQFRAARLELEYLAPGENTEGFENSKLLDMLVSRLRVLTQKAQQQESEIDQYHSQEMSLRQQLGSRVDAMAYLQDSLTTAKSEASRLELELVDRDESISKLSHALEGYRNEVKGLETFINRLEAEHAAGMSNFRDEIENKSREADARILDLELNRDTLEAMAEGREALMLELEKRLTAAVATSRLVEDEFAALRKDNSLLKEAASEREKTHGDTLAVRDAREAKLREEVERVNMSLKNAYEKAVEREKTHNEELALRDARVVELREEVERINVALKDAHDSAYDNITTLNHEKRDLAAQLEGEKAKIRVKLSGGAAKLRETCEWLLNDDSAAHGSSSDDGNISPGAAPLAHHVVVKPGPGLMLNAGLARRRNSSSGNSKKRRRYYSGLGFLGRTDEALDDSECV